MGRVHCTNGWQIALQTRKLIVIKEAEYGRRKKNSVSDPDSLNPDPSSCWIRVQYGSGASPRIFKTKLVRNLLFKTCLDQNTSCVYYTEHSGSRRGFQIYRDLLKFLNFFPFLGTIPGLSRSGSNGKNLLSCLEKVVCTVSRAQLNNFCLTSTYSTLYICIGNACRKERKQTISFLKWQHINLNQPEENAEQINA